MTTLFIDESKSRGYIIAATAIAASQVSRVRKELAQLRKPGQERLHFVKESPQRKRQILATLTRLGIKTHIYQAQGMPEPMARARCLAELVAHAATSSVTRIVLERDESIVAFDRRILFEELDSNGVRQRVSYAHEVAKSEPLLWIPDAIAWSHARGGEWKERIRELVEGVTEVAR